MNEIEFVNSLKDIPLPWNKYFEKGLKENFIERTIQRYNPKSRPKSKNVNIADPLIRLLANYDLSKTEIGMVCFDSEITENEDYYCFGKFEVEPLCLSKLSREIVMLSDETGLEILSCASSSEKFLDALIVGGKFLESRIVNSELVDDQAIVCTIAENCAELAGGQKYLNFYKLMLGCDY